MLQKLKSGRALRQLLLRAFRSFLWAVLCGSSAVAQAQAPLTQTPPKSITVVMDDNYPPFIFRDASGQLQGILQDTWALWEQHTGVAVKLRAMDWAQALQVMQAGQADVIDTIFETEARKQIYDFTAPYAKLDVPIFFHQSISGIVNADSLKGFTVGVKAGDACIDVLHAHGVDSTKPYPSYSALIAAAAASEVRVFCVDQPPAVYLLNQRGIEKEFRYSVPLYTGEFHRAVRKGNSALLKLVEDGFARISATERQTIERKWYGAEIKRQGISVYARYAASALLGLVLLAMALALWSRSLQRRVRAKTAELSSSLTALSHEKQITDQTLAQMKAAQEQIQRLAFSDPLTGLPNRRLLLDRLKHAMAASARHPRQGALLLIDLDNFKTVNDTLGHYQGDLLLQQVAQRLSACIREGDTVSRFGGDEFVVLLEHLSEDRQETATQAETVGEKILTTLNQTYLLGNSAQHSSASIGITLFDGAQPESTEEPLKRAELAMYQAKAAGHNTLRFFDPQMQDVVTARAGLEAGLRAGLRKNQFLLYYQAQVTGAGQITGAEALVRWQSPEHGIVPPVEFIPLAEETNLILPLGHWVLEAACTQLALWASQPALAHLTLAVNVSARQFHHKDFVDQVLAVLDYTGANPQRLKLELTESLLVANVEDVIAKMSALKSKGVGFSLDDFGTGYSSLSYLKRLPLDQLKIDISFVRDILTDPSAAAIAKTIIDLAENLGLAVIAEGVEIEGQRDMLARQGCQGYQGYLFSRPLPLAEFEAFAQGARKVKG